MRAPGFLGTDSALAERPECDAPGFAHPLKRPVREPTSRGPSPISPLIEFLVPVRRNASALPLQSLGEGPMRQLRAKVETMDCDPDR
jgi:hypothetical protein